MKFFMYTGIFLLITDGYMKNLYLVIKAAGSHIVFSINTE